ncbi:MAG: hypothetical protein LBI28_03010 [Treponema sp.]|jgi:tetratricopeptide (TPR) repeat protein|nr:hypothetical protein [Treponema sp.]
MSIKELGRDWSWLKKQYIGECKAKNPFTFELLFKDELNLEKNEKADKYDYVNRGRKYLAKCYERADIEKALADYNKAEELGMDGQRFYEERGLIYLSDLNDQDNAIADFTKALSQSERCPNSAKAVTLSWRSQAYRERGDLAAALADIQAAIELDSENSAWYYYRKMIHELMGNTQAAEWDWFKCELLYCLKGEDNATFFETQHHYSYTDEPEFYIATNNEGLEIRTKKREGEPIEPEILYSGRGNALFRRRPYQFILLTGFSKGWGQNIFGFGKVFVKENRNEKFPSSVPDVEAYPVKVRRILEPLDSLQNNFRIEIISIAEDGYPFLTALRALVYQHKDKTISEVICKEDLATLACILVREEDYEQLERFAAEFPDLLNEAAPAYFRPFRPTPLYYATLSLICGAMKDPVKMLRWLIDHGADPNKACGGDKCTPLGNQCFVGGNIEVMKILLSAGADPNKPAYQNDRGLSISPLFVVLCPDEYNEETHKFKPLTQGNVERAKLLVKAGANVNEINEAGETPLDMAITYSQAGEQAELLDLFRKSGADVDTALRDMEK